jgi:hypothetical protein
MTKEQNKKFDAELIRHELGVFSVKDLDEFCDSIEDFDNEAAQKRWAERIDIAKDTMLDLIKYSVWQQYKALSEFQTDPRMCDIIKGGINSLLVLKEYVDKKVSQHADNIKAEEKPTDPFNPLSE